MGSLMIGLMSGLCLDAGETGPPAKVCDHAPANSSRFCDKSLPPAARAAALVTEANLTELDSRFRTHFGAAFSAIEEEFMGVSLGIERGGVPTMTPPRVPVHRPLRCARGQGGGRGIEARAPEKGAADLHPLQRADGKAARAQAGPLRRVR